MKKILTLTLAAAMLLTVLAACGKSGGGASAGGNVLTDQTPAQIIDKIYEEKPVEVSVNTIDLDLTDANAVSYNTGLTDASKLKEVSVSEALIGSQAYSLVLVRVNDAKDAEAVANDMLAGINQRKWVCVEADDLKVSTRGDLVMLIMTQSDLGVSAADLTEAFKTVCGGTLDKELTK